MTTLVRAVLSHGSYLLNDSTVVGAPTGGGQPAPAYGPIGVADRPAGLGYVRYEDLYVAGNTLQQVLNKVTGGDVLTLPEGTFQFSDFANGYYEGIRLPAGCGGIWGSGVNTVLEMVPNSSTKAGDTTANPPSSGTNQCYLIGIWHSNQLLRNLVVHGTEQGHNYNGVRLAGNSASTPISGNTIQYVLFKGAARGTSAAPPGETFSLGTNHANSLQIIGCEFDGRNDAGTPAAASLIGPNNSTTIYVQDTYAHHTIAGSGIAFYRCGDIHMLRFRSWNNGTGALPFYGNGINLEEISGNVLIEYPDIKVNRASGNKGWHVGINSSTADGFTDDPNITITNVTNDNGPDNGCFSIMIGATYAGGPQAQTSMPTITKNGVTLVAMDKSVSIAGADPAKNFIRYHN